jgi:DNA-binding transcriptional MerR regulator
MADLNNTASITDIQLSFGVTPRALRHYENFGLIQAGRNGRNRRFYTGAMRRRIADIVLMREAGLSLGDIRRFLALRDRGQEELAAAHLRERLTAQRRRLDLMVKAADRIDRDMLSTGAEPDAPMPALLSAQA